MVLERGGLRYPLEIIDRFSDNALRFRDEIKLIRQEWNELRAAAKGSGITQELRGMARGARGAKKAAEGVRDLGRAATDAAEELTLQERAVIALRKELDRSALAAETDRQATKRGIRTKRQATAATNKQRRAQQLLNQARADASAAIRGADKIERDTAAHFEKERQKAINAELARGRKDASRILDAFDDQQAQRRATLVRAEKDAQKAIEKVRDIEHATNKKVDRDLQSQRNADLERGRKDATRILNAFDAQQKAHAEAEVKRQQEIQAQRERGLRQIRDRQAFVEQYHNRLKSAHAREIADRNRATKAQGGFNKQLKATSFLGDSIFFKFRRLIGTLAVFQAARAVGAGFRDLLASGIQFNQTLEQSELGLAGILTSVASITNAQGQQLQGAEKFAAATAIARDQQDKLRQDALSTVATYQELLNVFQIAMGPGLAAGLNVDQVRRISVLISQAASAIGLQQNQLSEEIRALLTGNIRSTTTRIAQVLSLTNEDIRNAQEQGNLFGLLEERLRGFELAAQGAAQTVGGLRTRLKDVFELITGRASQGLFEDLRSTLQEVFDSLTNRTAVSDGAGGFRDILTPSPEVQAAFQQIYDALSDVLRAAREAGRLLGVEGLSGVAAGIAAMLRIVGVALVNLIAGVSQGFGILVKIAAPFVGILRVIGATLDEIVGDGAANALVSSLTAGLVVVTAIGAVLKASVLLGLGKAVGLAKLLVVQFKTANAIKFPIIGIMAVALKEALDKALGIELTLDEIPKAAFLAFKGFARFLSDFFDEATTNVGLSLRRMKRIIKQNFAGELFHHPANREREEQNKADEKAAKEGLKIRRDAREKDLQNAIKAFEDERQAKKDIEARDRASGGTVTGTGTGPSSDDIRALSISQQRAALTLRQAEAHERLARMRLANVDEDERALVAVRDQLAIIEAQGDAKRTELGLARQKLQAEAGVALNEEQRAHLLAQARAIQDEILAGVREESAARFEQLAIEQEITRRIAARRAAIEIQQAQTAAVQARADAELLIAQQQRDRIPVAQQELNAARQELEVVRQEHALKMLQLEEERRVAQENLALAAPGSLGEETARAQLADVEGRISAEQTQQAANLLVLQERARRLHEIVHGTVGDGILEGFRSFGEQFSSAFNAGITIATAALQGFANLVSDTIADAFDPNNDTSIKERFGQFLQDLGRLIIQQMVQLAIARAILGVPAAPGGLGFAEGGPIRSSKKAQPSLAHMRRPRGLATGGSTARPRGLHPSDTIPIWAAPGEWMMKAKAVRSYGLDVMAAINDGLIDPSSLRALASSTKLPGRIRRPKAGFATGGSVTKTSGAQEAAGASQTRTIVQPALVANEDTFGRLLAGGEGTLHRWMRDNGYGRRA